MKNKELFNGYDPNFIFGNNSSLKIELPTLDPSILNDIVTFDGNSTGIVDYINYSVVLSSARKFPYYSASNIDGNSFIKLKRKDCWKKDTRFRSSQWGRELYKADKSDFDRGHMTKREDVQWGKNNEEARAASDTTYFYSNAVPQHSKLNQRIWKNLEDYILCTETNTNKLKICVFTGPVLNDSDPYFVTMIKGESIQIPILFWKVVVFTKSDGKLYRVGFLMSQNRLLIDNGIVDELESSTDDSELFMQFDDAETYQVNVELIEKITKLKFASAIDSYKDDRNIKLIFNKIEVDSELESLSLEEALGYSISNLVI